MEITASFVEVTSLHDLEPLRTHYLDSLGHAQDALLEVLVGDARYYRIEESGQLAGYFVLRENVLLEYFVTLPFETFCIDFLPLMITRFGIERALVKTFDHQFLAAAIDLQASVHVKGALVRGYERRALPALPNGGFRQRVALLEDLPRVLAVRQTVFTHEGRLRAVIAQQQMRLFEVADTLIGFGIQRPIIAGRRDVEIGVVVDEPYRQSGYAMHMLQAMADYCVECGLWPVSGCARENEASVRTGLRIGYISRHRLLEITFRRAA